MLDSAAARVSMTIKTFFFSFQALLSPVWVPGQFSHKLDLLFDGELLLLPPSECAESSL